MTLPDRRLLPSPKRSRFGFAQAGPAGSCSSERGPPGPLTHDADLEVRAPMLVAEKLR